MIFESSMQLWITHNGEREKLRFPFCRRSSTSLTGRRTRASPSVASAKSSFCRTGRPWRYRGTAFSGRVFSGHPDAIYAVVTGCDDTAAFEWKISAKPVHLILTGTRVNFYAAIQSLQPYRKGGDPGSIYYKIKLKEYREVRIRQVKVSSTGTATVSGGSTRTDNRVQAKTYTVKPGDCLYNISKSTLGDGGRYNEIYSLNKDKLKNPNLIYPGQVLQLP